MTHKDNITSLKTGVLCLPYSVESAGIGPPALKEEGMPMEYHAAQSMDHPSGTYLARVL